MRTWIELIKPALRSNCATVKKFSNKHTAFVVKANAYGHGAHEISSFLEQEQCCDMLCIAHAYEIDSVRSAWNGPLILLGYVDQEALLQLHNTKGICAIGSLETARLVRDFVQQHNVSLSVHLKLETGMHRLGVTNNELEQACSLLASDTRINVTGVYTHCFDSSSYDRETITQQSLIFDQLAAPALKKFPHAITHVYPTGAISEPNTYDMTRCGAALYGLWKSDGHKKRVLEELPGTQYHQVMRWKTKIMQIKKVAAGEHISYGKFFQATHPMRIAVLPVGYADGYPRLLSGRGHVIIKGKLAPLCGYVSMNFATVDITAYPDIQIGDEVVLTSPEYEAVSLPSLGKLLDMPPQTFSTGIAAHIPRFLVDH